MTRTFTDLSGPWRFQPDAYEDGEALGYAADAVDTRLWREVYIPCAFDDCGPAMAAYEGAGWFRRTFDLAEAQCARRLVLRFEGVNYNARVWVNGVEAGAHEGGFLPFEIPLEGLVRPGRNFLAVRADNTRRAGEVPGRQRGWRPYGGILREVTLIAMDRLRVEARVVRTDADGGLSVRVRMVNGRAISAQAHVRLRLLETIDEETGSSGREIARVETSIHTLAPGEAAETLLETRAEVTPWSPETPARYNLVIELDDGAVCDAVCERIGFRTIETRGAELFLNGQPLRLQGFNRHEDGPERGMCPDPEQAQRDLMHMKELGANFVRLCHYPHPPSTLDLCDALGLVAMAEIPLYWWRGREDGEEAYTHALDAARRQLTELIARDVHHPSVLFWSVSNETRDDLPEVAAGNAELVALAKALDPTRLAVHVSDKWPNHPRFERDDVLCVNAYPSQSGRCWQRQADYDFARSTDWWRENLERLHALHPDRPILITEYGYPAHEGVRENALGEDAQAAAILAEQAAFDAPYVCGHTIWCYADHPWPEEDFIKNTTTSPFGVVTRDRRRKAICERLTTIAPWGAPADEPEGGWYVRMFRPDMRNLPEAAFPPGFAVRAFRPGDEGLWADIQRDAERHFEIADDLFAQQYGEDLPGATHRIYFLVNERDIAVGTLSAWYSRDELGQDWGRIHWVAVRPQWQGRGLARAGLAYTLQQMAQWHVRAYLTTSTGRHAALRLYLNAGFLPDLTWPDARKHWESAQRALNHPALAAALTP